MDFELPTERRVAEFARAIERRTPPWVELLDQVIARPLVRGRSPWVLWLLVGLDEHERRVAWARRLFEDCVTDVLGDEAVSHGVVRGVPEWDYEVIFGSCALVSRTDGTRIEWTEESTGAILESSIVTYLETAGPVGPVEQALPREVFAAGLRTDLGDLDRAGWVDRDLDGGVLRLTDAGREALERIDPILGPLSFEPGLASACRLAALGDLVHALKCAGSSVSGDLRTRLERGAEGQIERRAGELRARLESAADENEGHASLLALASLGPERVEADLLEVLASRPIDRVLDGALEVLEAWGGRPHVHAVVAVLERCGNAHKTILRGCRIVLGWLDRDTIEPGLGERLIEILLREPTLDMSPEILEVLPPHLVEASGAGTGHIGGYRGEADLMIYCLDPERGLRRMTEGLASGHEVLIGEAIAALTVVDTPRSRRILQDAAEGGDRTARAAVRQVLEGIDTPPEGQEEEAVVVEPEEIAPGVFHGSFRLPTGAMPAAHAMTYIEIHRQQLRPILERWSPE